MPNNQYAILKVNWGFIKMFYFYKGLKTVAKQ